VKKIILFLIVFTTVILTYRLFSFINKYAVNLLYDDQWWIADMIIENKPFKELFFYLYSEHRIGVGLIIMRTLAVLTYWNTRFENFGFGISVIIIALFSLALKYKLAKKFEVTDIAIPIIILLIGTLIALFTFIISRRFFQLKKVFCFTNCIFLVITITYSAKYLGIFRSTKDIVKKCLSDKGENYILFSYARTVPSLVFYSGKNILQMEDHTQWKTLIPNPETSAYVVMSLNDYQKKQDWIQKRKLHDVCQNNAHVILKRENN